MANELSFLEGETSGPEDVNTAALETPPEAPESAVAPTETPAPETAPERPRGPDGKFAPAKAETPTPAPAEPGHVPLAAMLDERDKRQALEKQLAALQAERDAAAKANAEPLPLEAQVQQQLYVANLKASRRFAEREYGKETVATVHDWASAKCDADPVFNAQMQASEDPYEAAMQAYNREKIIAGVTSVDELAQFQAWKAAQAQVQASTQSLTPSSPAQAIPRSLANAPGNGAQGAASVAVGEGNAYAGLFK